MQSNRYLSPQPKGRLPGLMVGIPLRSWLPLSLQPRFGDMAHEQLSRHRRLDPTGSQN